jgi:uncharacterized protein
MEFNVAQLMKERVGATRKYEVHDNIEQLDPDLVVLDELSGEVRLLHTLEGILVTGRLETTLGLMCDRCLSPFAQKMEIELEDEFKPSIDIVSGASLPVLPEDEDNLIDEHHILDLREVVRQRLLINQPPHALCKVDCLGLCPTCGRNLNEGACDCPAEEPDPRWASLRELLS